MTVTEQIAVLSPRHGRLLAYLGQQYELDHNGLARLLTYEATERGEGERPLADVIEDEARRLQAYWREVAETGKTNLGDVDGPEREQFRRWYQEITALLDGGLNH